MTKAFLLERKSYGFEVGVNDDRIVIFSFKLVFTGHFELEPDR